MTPDRSDGDASSSSFAPRRERPDAVLVNALGQERLPGYLGIEVMRLEPGTVAASLEVQPWHLAPNGFLHGGTVVALADTACGYGCVVSLPEGASGFTTAELKSNFFATVTEGAIDCRARLVHAGRTTQVWDAEVVDDRDRTLALFRCTQIILWPRDEA